MNDLRKLIASAQGIDASLDATLSKIEALAEKETPTLTPIQVDLRELKKKVILLNQQLLQARLDLLNQGVTEEHLEQVGINVQATLLKSGMAWVSGIYNTSYLSLLAPAVRVKICRTLIDLYEVQDKNEHVPKLWHDLDRSNGIIEDVDF